MRTGFSLAVVTALQLVAGLAGQLVVLRIVGVGDQSDAYVAAQAPPLVLFAVVAVSLQNMWAPRFARLAGNAAEFRTAVAEAQGQSFKLLMVLATLIWVTSTVWTLWLFPGFSREQHVLVSLLSAPLLGACVFTAQSGILTAALRASGHFLRAELTALVFALTALVMLGLLVPRYGILAAAWIVLARAAFVYAGQWAQSGRPGMALRPSDASREVWRQARPLAGSAIFIKSTPLVDRYWSTQGGSGGASVLNLAQLLVNSAASVIERAVLVPVLPAFARLVEKGDFAGLKALYLRSLKQASLCTAAFVLLLLPLLLVWDDLLMRSLRMDAQPAQQMYAACMLLAPILLSAVGASSAAAAFYAMGETRLPSLIGSGGFALSLVIKGLLFHAWGILGLAAGAALYVFVVFVLYHVAILRRLRREMQINPPE